MFHEAVLNEILDERVVSSRGRRNYRGVKRKMSSYPIRPKSTPLQQDFVHIEKYIKILM